MSDLTKSSFRISPLDAALLCSLDYLAEGMKAEKKIRALEAQLELYEVNLKNAREEIERYRAAEKSGTAEGERERVEEIGDALRSDANATSEDKIRALEKYLESRRTVARPQPSDAKSREDKIKYIESLLRGGDSNN
jgi:multidrug resistance efflux pump